MSSAEGLTTARMPERPDERPAALQPATPLSLRLIVIFFSAAFLLVLAASSILYEGTLSALQGADDQVVDKRAATISALLDERELNEGMLAHEVNDDNQGPRQIFIRVVTPAKQAAVETEGMGASLPPATFPVPGPQGEVARSTQVNRKGEMYRMSSRKVRIAGLPAMPEAVIQVATDTSLDQNALVHFRRILLSVIGAALPLCALVAWLIVRRELFPLARISAATRAIDASSIGQRLEFHRLPAELHDLAVQFNAMLARIEVAWKDLEHYGDTIAHEMRTPLNRMRLNCEIALDKPQSTDDLREVIAANLVECERLTRLLNGLLFLARADSHHAAPAAARIAPAEHIHTVHEFFKADAAERDIALIENCRAVPAINADRDLFKQALANLVSNALAHTPKGGTVTLGCEVKDQQVLIHVSDTGSGIAAADRNRIFDRFYRASPSRSDEGLGLGLAITKSIATLHGGQISFESAVGKGTTFTLAFPRA